MNFRSICALLAGLILCPALASPAAAAESLTLQLKWTHAFQFAGYYAAEAMGYYRDAGLEVTIKAARPGDDVVGEVVAGRANFGVGSSSLLLERKAGKPVVVLAAIFQHSPQVLVARQTAPNQSVHDLVDKRVMFEPQTDELTAYLKREAIPLDRVERLPHSFSPQDLIDGKVDAITAYSTNEPYFLLRAGLEFLVFTPRSVGIDFYGDNLFTSEAELRAHPERVRAFLEASLRGWEYALDHPDEIIELIASRHAPGISREFLRFEAEKMIPLIRRDLVAIGYMNAGRWRHIADTYAEIGMLPAGFQLDGFLHQKSSEHDLSRYSAWLAAALLALSVISAIALYVAGINARLRRSREALALRSDDLLLKNRVLKMLNSRAGLGEVLDTLARGVETRHPDLRCSILLIDEDGRHIRHGAAPSLPGFFVEAMEGLAIGEGVACCGTAAHRNERVIVDDIASHPFWAPFRELARRAGIGACWSQPFTNAGGQVTGSFAIYHAMPTTPSADEIADIERYVELAGLAVERARTDAALRRAEERYRLISDNSNDVIWLLDLPDLRFSYISPSVRRLRGWTAEEIMAQPLTAALTPESAEQVDRALQRALSSIAAGNPDARFSTMELDQPCKDGSIVATEVVSTILLDADGRPRQILGITRDITERRRNEAELTRYREHLEQMVAERTLALSVAKDAAESASRAKSTFLATMSHELRTPMNAIMGMTELALRRAADDKQKEQLNKVIGASRHLLAVINDILDLSRIEAEKLTLASTAFRLGGVLENVRSLVGHLAAEKGLALSCELPQRLEMSVLRGDPDRLGQILLNLCSNAVKFTEHGEVAIRVLQVAATPSHLTLRFEVRDTGIGIAAADQQRLFSAFEQADGSFARKYGGSGLGLAISKRLAGLMGGEIGVRSQPGAGSTFWFTACLERGSDAGHDPFSGNLHACEERLRREHPGARILLVEDEPINREVSRDLLEEAGVSVDTATDGEEACQRAAGKRYDLILMDMQMPRMNGLDATRAIRALPGGATVPIIAMTANAFAEDRQRCLAAGMNDHIGKPVDPETLFATLLRWLPGPPA
ncbi:MAG: response regulator [Dechloromonas sp.]|nr:MAG: response regulator [Dechloromonas sp.]